MSSASSWDIALMKEFIGDDPAVLRALLSDYLVAMDQTLSDLELAIAADDTHTVAAVAHKFKSTSRWVGAQKLGDLCEALEKKSLATDLVNARRAHGQLVAECDLVRTAINSALLDLR